MISILGQLKKTHKYTNANKIRVQFIQTIVVFSCCCNCSSTVFVVVVFFSLMWWFLLALSFFIFSLSNSHHPHHFRSFGIPEFRRKRWTYSPTSKHLVLSLSHSFVSLIYSLVYSQINKQTIQARRVNIPQSIEPLAIVEVFCSCNWTYTIYIYVYKYIPYN